MEKLRVACIGSTGKGNYGHGLDVVFQGLDRFELVAVADDSPAGLESAGKRLGVNRRYANYREMLEKERPALVSIGPRWTDQRLAMISAAAEVGASVFCEKPMAASVGDADAIVDKCKSHGVLLALAHQWRSTPPAHLARKMAREGKFGKLVRLRARGKEDHRGGGEDLIVLGVHVLDMMTFFAGPPIWVQGTVQVGGRPITVADRRQPSEPVGPVAGDNVLALFGFADGVVGEFSSRARVDRPGRSPFGLFVEYEEATLAVRGSQVYVYPSSTLVAENAKFTWEKLIVPEWHFTPDHKPRDLRDWLHLGNQRLVNDLADSMQEKREPISGGATSRWTLEMIQGTYGSSLANGQRLALPLADRKHPLG